MNYYHLMLRILTSLVIYVCGNMKVSLFSLFKQQEKKEDKSDKTEDEKN